ncbi:sodium:glutamate symporter [Helcobacillus sp. ACRRO]|uniref:sodium/glutamate symporter n=1 Tax=Helcobacillus TaxID=1161125 RepID=UPI001EF48A64|nr:MULTISPECIES: sodium:glutamate symporter [Helcobacillus]MCG7426320.1 sodium:glutamate symporter [Helcobacillus sp. ACRRO]MDK7742917.1 sodium:glutamate symporter [Helcobacillus massiliensis]WOO92090.1 sodium:glutamate symporter [Helcobacillus massiliensis]
MSAWDVFLDLAWMGLLLAVGALIRATVPPVQALFLPASLIAGVLGLILGPAVFGVIPFSELISQYSGLLIAVVFGALPFTMRIVSVKSVIRSVGSMWAVTQGSTLMQWGFGLLMSLMLLSLIFGGLPDGFGLMLAAGFMGGHGTAAAVAEGFGDRWPDAASLGFTSATIGIFVAIIGGITIIKLESRRGGTAYLQDFADLPRELRTGVLEQKSRAPIGRATVSTMSIDPLMLHASILAAIAGAAYLISEWFSEVTGGLSFPAFAVAFIVGGLVLLAMRTTGADRVLDSETMNRVSGSATDLLVAFGIAAISPAVVARYWQPLALLLVGGLILLLFSYVFVWKPSFRDHKVEQSVFSFGWQTGTVPMGIALLRIVDPQMRSKTLDYYGLAYIPINLGDIVLMAFLPALVIAGFAWPLAIGLTVAALAIYAFALRLNRGHWHAQP